VFGGTVGRGAEHEDRKDQEGSEGAGPIEVQADDIVTQHCDERPEACDGTEEWMPRSTMDHGNSRQHECADGHAECHEVLTPKPRPNGFGEPSERPGELEHLGPGGVDGQPQHGPEPCRDGTGCDRRDDGATPPTPDRTGHQDDEHRFLGEHGEHRRGRCQEDLLSFDGEKRSEKQAESERVGERQSQGGVAARQQRDECRRPRASTELHCDGATHQPSQEDGDHTDSEEGEDQTVASSNGVQHPRQDREQRSLQAVAGSVEMLDDLIDVHRLSGHCVELLAIVPDPVRELQMREILLEGLDRRTIGTRLDEAEKAVTAR
jgi:hypothetical protein